MNNEQNLEMPESARERFAGKVSRFLFGNDAFISYARRDATIYSLGLANQLTKKELSCFLDQWGTPSGKELPGVVVSTLKRSNMLVLLGTERAAGSDAVKREIIEFKKTGRTIIPVSFDGALEKASWFDDLIAGISIAQESKQALETGKPSENVIDRIVNAENFTRRNKRLRNYFWITAASVVVMLMIGALVGFVIVSKANAQRQDAENRRQEAVRLAGEAEEKRTTAEAEASRLSTVAQQAQDLQKRAEGKAEDAAKKEAEASANAQQQEQLAVAQKKIADEQKMIADEQQQRSRRLTYIGNMQLAQQTFEVGKVDKSEKLLSEFLSTDENKELRGFEWFYLWNTLHRKQADIAAGPDLQGINSFTFLPGKRQFVTAGYQNLRVWDANTNQIIAKADGSFERVSYSRDGHMIASATENEIKLFNAQSLAPMKGIAQWPRKFHALAFSPAENSMLVTADESEVNLWEVTPSGMRRMGQTIPVRGESVVLAYSPDGKYLGINSGEKIEIWDTAFTNKIQLVETQMPSNKVLLFFPDNQTVGFIDRQTVFQVWDFKTLKLKTSFKLNVGVPALPSPDQNITAAISYDGQVLVAASLDPLSYGGGVKMWDITTGELMVTFDGLGLNGVVSALAFSEDDKTLAICNSERVQFSNATRLHSVKEIEATVKLNAVPAVSADGNVLVMSSASNLSFYNTSTAQFERKYERKPISHISFSSDGSKFVTTTIRNGKRAWSVELFDTRTNAPWGPPLGETEEPQVALSPDAKTVVTGTVNHDTYDCDAGCLQFWDVATGTKTPGIRPKKKNKIPSYGAVPIMFSPNGKLLVFRSNLVDGHSVEIVDVATKRSLAIIAAFNEGDFTSFAFSPDGNSLAIGSKDSTVSIWNVSSLYYATPPADATEEWKPGDKHFIAQLEGHVGDVRSVAFSRDDKTLATASVDGTVKLWDTRFYQPLITLKGNGTVALVAFSADGRSLITADSRDITEAYSIKFWRAASNEDVALRK